MKRAKIFARPAPVERDGGGAGGPGVGLVAAEDELVGAALLGQPRPQLRGELLGLPVQLQPRLVTRVSGAHAALLISAGGEEGEVEQQQGQQGAPHGDNLSIRSSYLPLQVTT